MKKKSKLRVTIVGSSDILRRFGYPCFHCGKSASSCKKKKCCAKCKGIRRSH
jgi:hypothetical protein